MSATTETAPPDETPEPSPTPRAPRPPRPPSGWRVIARKELGDHVTSVRFAILVLLLSLAAVAAVAAAAGRMRAVAPDLSGASSVFLRLFTIQLSGTPFSFSSFVALIGPLLGIAFGFDAISSERSARTLPRLMSQPIHRDDVVNGKFAAGLAAIAIVLTALTLATAGVGILGLGMVPSVTDAGRLLAWLAVSIVYVGVWLALAILLSVRLERAATSAIAGIAVWLVLTLFSGLLVGMVANVVAPAGADATNEQVARHLRTEQMLSRVSPGFLYEEATGPLLIPEQRTLSAVISPMQAYRAIPGSLSLRQSVLLVWPQVVSLFALVTILFTSAYTSFLREEIRA